MLKRCVDEEWSGDHFDGRSLVNESSNIKVSVSLLGLSIHDTSFWARRSLAKQSRWQTLLHQVPLLWVAAGSSIAICLDQILIGSFQASLLIWGIVLLLGLAMKTVRLPRWARLMPVLCVGATFFGIWHSARDLHHQSASIQKWLGPNPEPAIVRGEIASPVTIRNNPLADAPGRSETSPWQSQIVVQLDSMRIGTEFQSIDGNVLAFVDDHMGDYRPGDRIEIYGLIQPFGSPTNPGERDLSQVYRHRGLHGRIDVATRDGIVQLEKGSRWLWSLVADVAASGRDSLLTHTSPENGALAVALVIGQREFVDPETRDALLATGTAHLLSVSGLHLAIIVFLATWIATVLQFRFGWKAVFLAFVCTSYVAITGGRPPVVRAAILVGAVLIALWVKRPSKPLNSLAAAALILIFFNPENVFAVGVHLSFLAVMTLMLCGREINAPNRAVEMELKIEQRIDALADQSRHPMSKYARWLLARVWELAWFSGCVSLISLPLVWHQFHLVSWISVVTNVLLTPGLLLALPFGVLTVIAGLVSETAAVIPGALCDLSLSYMRWVIDLAAAFPGGHAWLPSPPTWWIAVFYIVIVSTIGFIGKRALAIRCIGIVFWIVIAWWMATTGPAKPDGSLEATFVDVGHGTSVVLRMPDDTVWLYDCGYLGNETNRCRDIDTTLWSLGVTRLHGIFLSHADSDHYNALPGLLRRFQVDQIITPIGMLKQDEPGLEPIRASIARFGVPIKEVGRGDTPAAFMSVLHPPDFRIEGSDNANSLVLSLRCGGKTLLLPGDLESPGTSMLIDQTRPPAGSVLMAPHHGSLSNDSDVVLRWSRPKHVVVSGGRRAKRPEVAEMLAQTGSDVHVTAATGACRVIITSDGVVSVQNWLDDPW